MGEPQNAPYIFISYASADRDRVMPVVEALRRVGVSVWLDQQSIAGGENYAREIVEGIRGCAAHVLLCSSASLASRNVKQEVGVAWKYERPYLPLLLEPVAIPDDLSYFLEMAQWIEVLDKHESEWLPQVIAALAPLGIAPKPEIHEEIHLAGRDKELALLREKLASAKGGKGGLVLIGGEAGIGKTTLAGSALHEAAARGFTVLEGHAFDLAETPPYGPFIDLFLHLPDAPAMPPLPEAFAVRGTVGAVASQMALFAQVEDFLRALSDQRPVAMLLDDLHWSDPASLDLLRFLARSVATMSLLVLVTYRSDELTRRHPLSQLLPQLAREAGAARIDLGRLDDDAVSDLITERYGLPDADADRLVSYLQGRAEGNALFVGELLRALEEGGVLARDGWRLGDLARAGVPTLLRQVIEGRVARLDEDAVEALGAAAVIGQEVPVAIWAAVSGTDENALTEIVEDAAAARLMEETPDGTSARFLHALIREALYEGILPSRRRRLHRVAGETLAALPNPDADAVAHHFRVVGDARTASWLAKAGERARVAFAYTTAVERMREAVALLDKPGDAALVASLCLQISYMLRSTDKPQSIRYAEEAIRRAEEAGDAVLAGVARCRLGTNLWFDRQWARGIAALRAGVTELEALPPEAWGHTATPQWYASGMEADRASAVDVRAALAFAIGIIGAHAESLALLGGTPDMSDAALATANVERLFALGIAYENLGRPEIARRINEEIHHVYRAKEDWYTLGAEATLFLYITASRYGADDPAYCEGLASEAEEAWAQAQALHLAPPFPVRASRFPLNFIAGAWEAARTSAAAMQPLGGPIAHAATWTLGMIARLCGRQEEARRYVRDFLPEGAATEPGAHPLVYGLLFLHLGGLLALDAGNLDEARGWAEASDRWLAWSGSVRGNSEGQALWAQYHRQAGDREKAHEHAERGLAHATAPRQPLALITAHRLLGELDTDAGRHDDSATHLEKSLALADACQAPFERALTLLAMAELQAATGETETAKTLIDEVRAICAPLGAKPTLALADALASTLAGS